MLNEYKLVIMKRKLNFFTVLIIVAIGIILNYSDVVSAFKEGFMEGYNSAQTERKGEQVESYWLNLKPIVPWTKPTTIVNVLSGESLKARVKSIVVEMPAMKSNVWSKLWNIIIATLLLTGLFLCIINFLTIIVAVNKSVIFEWINVKRLRRIGMGFLILFVMDIALFFTNHYQALKTIELADYKILNPSIDGYLLFLSMIAFLIAEVIAVGLRLKEDSDLTI